MGHKKKKTKKVLWIVNLIMVTLAISGIFWLVMNQFKGKADTNTVKVTSVDNKSNKEILTVHSNFYNYRYDDEMKKGKRTQGSQSSDNQYSTPCGIFNEKLNWYYTQENFGKGIDVGIYMGNFYWYWKNGITEITNQKTSGWDWCINNYQNFYWAANIANRYGEENGEATYAAACQGIVDAKLKDFNSTLAAKNNLSGTLTNNEKAVPFFNKEFLNWTWDAQEGTTTIGAYAEDVGFPFRAEYSNEKGNYYVFDSTKDVVRFKGMETGNATQSTYYFGSNKQLEYYYGEKQVSFSTSSDGGEKPYFFPFNKSENVVRKTGENNNNLDYGFGVRLDIPFYVTENGMQDDDGVEKPMKFNFSGDDDVWIFLDGELVLDLGGQHGAATGYIDFSTEGDKATAVVEEVSYLSGTTNPTSKSHCFETNNTDTKKQETPINVTKDADHVLTIFYMERGMIESNLYMDFSFIPHDAETPTVTPTPTPTVVPDDDTVDTKLNVETKVECNNVNSKFLDTVKDVVENDGFQYKVQNKGTLTTDVGDSGLAYPSGVLSVRKNREKTRYWSFGERPKIRVYFDLKAAKDNIKSLNTSSETRGDDNNYIVNWNTGPYIKIGGGTPIQMLQGPKTDTYDYYYRDIAMSSDTVRVGFTNNATDQYGDKIAEIKEVSISESDDGILFTPTQVQSDRQNQLLYSTEKANANTHPANGSSGQSNNLPYQTKTTPAPTYAPNDTTATTNYSAASDTAYQLTEFYTAKPDSSILINSATTTGITNSSGILSLLSEDIGSFIKQFKVGSSMKIVQQQKLATVQDKTPSGTGDNGSDYVSEFEEGSRGSYDYYHTTVTAKDSNDGDINVNSKGEFSLLNVATGSATDVEVTETFTNTVKTGSIVLEKKLKGCTDTGAQYTFTLTFKNIFGGEDPADYTAYELPYELYTINDNGEYEKSKDETLNGNGQLTLQANQRAVITGIPVGTAYQITEENASADTIQTIASSIKVTYDTTTSDGTKLTANGSEESITTGENGKIEGVIPTQVKAGSITSNEFENVEVGITFTNQAGVLKITKYVTGEWDGTDNEYTFTIQDSASDTSLEGKAYTIYKESANTGGSYGSTTGEVVSTGTLGNEQQITLQAGQWAEISDLPIVTGNGHTYTITEEKGYYDLAEVSVKRGIGTVKEDDEGNPIAFVTNELNGNNPQVDVVFSNAYSSYYIDIKKYIDNLYYAEDEYYYKNSDSDNETYQNLSNAEQSFIFKVEEHDESDCSDEVTNVFNITIPITQRNVLETPVKKDDVTYKYMASQRIQVTPGKYYKITEDTSWSWKYTLESVAAEYNGTRLAKDAAVANVSDGVIILNGYRKNSNNTPSVPTAIFYNKRNAEKEDIEGDTGNVVNKIVVSSSAVGTE